MRLTYTNLADGTHLPIWCGRRDKFRNISNACRHVRGMHARTHAPRILPCVINYVSSEQKVNLTCEKASAYKKVQVRQGETKTMEVKGGKKQHRVKRGSVSELSAVLSSLFAIIGRQSHRSVL